MRRTPDKETIIRLKAQGLSFIKIGELYDVSDTAIRKAFHNGSRRAEIVSPCYIPQHVVNYWRNVWGWSEDKISEAIALYNQSLMRRHGNKIYLANKEARRGGLKKAL